MLGWKLGHLDMQKYTWKWLPFVRLQTQEGVGGGEGTGESEKTEG